MRRFWQGMDLEPGEEAEVLAGDIPVEHRQRVQLPPTGSYDLVIVQPTMVEVQFAEPGQWKIVITKVKSS